MQPAQSVRLKASIKISFLPSQLSLDEMHLNVRIMINFVNHELSVLFETELVPSPTTYNGDGKVVWLRVNSSEK